MSSTKQNWWGAFTNEEPDGREHESATSQAGIQTEGRILHYPAGSKWLNATDDSSFASVNRSVKYFINHEGRRTKHNYSNPPAKIPSVAKEGYMNYKIDVSSKASSQRLSKGDIFSPMSDPLHHKNKQKKNCDSLSVGSNRSRR